MEDQTFNVDQECSFQDQSYMWLIKSISETKHFWLEEGSGK